MTISVKRAAVQFASVIPHLAVPDVVHTAEYYRDVLGFAIAGYWDGDAVHQDPSRDTEFGIVRRGRAVLHLNRAEQDRSTSQLAGGAYDLYFDVTELDALAEELRRRGAEIVEGPEERAYGRRELVVRDCNGLVLAFGESQEGSVV